MFLYEFGEGLLYSNFSHVIFRVYVLIHSFIFTVEYKTLNPMQNNIKLFNYSFFVCVSKAFTLHIFYLKETVHTEI